LRTGAPWADLPRRYPPYQTCHRRFQGWVNSGVFEKILNGLREHLKEGSGIREGESVIDGTYVPAKKKVHVLGSVVPEMQRRSWQLQTAMVFHSLSSLLKDPDTTLFSPNERSTLRLWTSSLGG
jgi:hypothetical protein